MKIIYKKTISEQIDAAIVEALSEDRDIEQITLSLVEWERLKEERHYLRAFVDSKDAHIAVEGFVGSYNGILLKLEEVKPL